VFRSFISDVHAVATDEAYTEHNGSHTPNLYRDHVRRSGQIGGRRRCRGADTALEIRTLATPTSTTTSRAERSTLRSGVENDVTVGPSRMDMLRRS
jgi:hypothetical protein